MAGSLLGMEFDPAAFVAMWGGGLALASAVVAWWQVAKRGFSWLAGGVVAGLGGAAALAGGGPLAWLGAAAALGGLALADHPRRAAGAFAAGGVALVAAAAIEANLPSALSGALLLGGVTAEMVLGHWYLVDPRLPRWALRRLAIAGAAGALIDAAIEAVRGAHPWVSGDVVVGLGWLVLAATTAVLMTLAWSALGERGYSGVMAATGLSYLAVLTGLGAAVAGRLLVDGPVLG